MDSFGTDKQITFYHIRNLFRRRYDYFCSSNQCPSKSSPDQFLSDHVSDMTLHEPVDGIGSGLERSIREWELGTSKHALVSCKVTFPCEPVHTEFITEIDHGKSICRCSGWRNVSNIFFVDNPPFLIFNISASYRDKIVSLVDVPRQISVYNEMYKLGGVTSYVQIRRHYVGYIPNNDVFLFYDGLPSSNPVLKKYSMSRIHGDISLLVYFPVDNLVDFCPSVCASEQKNNDPLSTSKDNSRCETKVGIESPNDDTASVGKSHEISDHLLAKALFELEGENAYKKPRGKSYRKSKTSYQTIDEQPLSCKTSLASRSPSPQRSVPAEPNNNSNLVNTEIIQFISRKKGIHSLHYIRFHVLS